MSQTDWIGETLNGRYKITELLGQGGMSAVYKANDPNLRRVVAIKLIHSHLSNDPEFVRRFEEEAAAVAQLRHPNLIQVFDFTNDGKTYYIVFEFVPGETVQSRVKRLNTTDRQMGIDETVSIVAQTADGLNYAHKKGLIHRDIKPANIMLNVQNSPIVMDFGIAKIMGGTQHTATGAVLGTARYMSPEQIKGERIDPRTDIYSLGVTMFEMLGGRPPFNADSAMTLMMMHMTDPVPDLRDLRADVPAGLVAVVNKALAKNPDDRFDTAADFAKALRSPDQVAQTVGGTTVESPVRGPDPDKTVVEPVFAAAALADTGETPAAETPVIPRTPPETAAPSGGIPRNILYIAGGALALILLLAGIWAVFLRGDDTSGAEPTTVAEVIVPEEPTEQPTAEPTTAPTTAPTQAPTTAPTAEPTAAPVEPPPGSRGSITSARGDVTLLVDGQEMPIGLGGDLVPGSQLSTGDDGAIEFELEDGSTVQLGASSILEIRELAEDPTDVTQESVLTLIAGDFLLRQIEPGNILTLLDGEGNLLGSLQEAVSSSAKPAYALARVSFQDAPNGAAMAINVGPDADSSVLISCFAGICIIGDSLILAPGEELIIDRVARAIVERGPITTASTSYAAWQRECPSCVVAVPEAIAEEPTEEAVAPTEAPPTEAPTQPPAPTATTAPPPTQAPPTPTTAPPPTEPPAQEFFVRITNIGLENGQYIVSYETTGYTETLPGRHVHFYFDTVSEANAGSPGSGPWELYGGPRPFTRYGEAQRPAGATSMCARVANADHSIIYGTGNCYPLP